MRETNDELVWLQDLIDRSFERAGAHQVEIMTPERRLSARQTVRLLDGIGHVAFATVDGRGRPRVSALDALFLHGRFHVSTSGTALKVAHLRRATDVSLVSYRGDDHAIVVHGRASVHGAGDPATSEWDELATSLYGSSPFSWGSSVVMIRVDPERMYTYAPHPSAFPD